MRQEKKMLQEEEDEEVKEGGWGQGHRFGTGPWRVQLNPLFLVSARHSCSSKLEGVFFNSSVTPPSFPPPISHFLESSDLCTCVLLFQAKEVVRLLIMMVIMIVMGIFFFKRLHTRIFFAHMLAICLSPLKTHSSSCEYLERCTHTHTHTQI